jgi:peptidoglycan/LPS O-acetylase OafA/YrhL
VLHTLVLGSHIATGSAGLLLGPLAMAAPKHRGWHTRVGLAYQVAIAALTVSALGLVAFAPGRLWWLALIACGTEVAALAGWREPRRRRPGWRPRHVGLVAGSYVSLVTALLVVNWSSPLSWILPTLIGTPLIARASARAARQPGPSRPSEPSERSGYTAV